MGVKRNQAAPAQHEANRGAYMVEAAMSLTVFMVVFISLLDYAYYLVIWHSFQKACNNGITLAVKIPNIEKDRSDPSFQQAEAEVKQRALQYPGSLGNFGVANLNVSVIRPGEPGHPTFDHLANTFGLPAAVLLQAYPIAIRITADLPIPLPFVNAFSISTYSLGFV